MRIGHYTLEEEIGRGGMGIVHRAVDTRLGRRVAIKVLPADATIDPDRRRRFIQEARAASALNHPHIVTIHDIGEKARPPSSPWSWWRARHWTGCWRRVRCR